MEKMELMEVVVSIQNRESLTTALDRGVGAVSTHLPRDPDSQVFSELADWRDAARQHGCKFYLTWDWLVRERELAGVPDMLAAVARIDPDALQLRDLGLIREARRRYPNLPLQAAGNFGTHNSPGVRLAATLGFTRVVIAGPISLKDLALMRRQTAMPLAVTLATGCQGYAGFCLMEEYLGVSCDTCCLARQENAGIADQYVWQHLRSSGARLGFLDQVTVAYRTRHAAHYERAGEAPPPDAIRRSDQHGERYH